MSARAQTRTMSPYQAHISDERQALSFLDRACEHKTRSVPSIATQLASSAMLRDRPDVAGDR